MYVMWFDDFSNVHGKTVLDMLFAMLATDMQLLSRHIE